MTAEDTGNGLPPTDLTVKRTVTELLVASAAVVPDLDAIVGVDGRVTFADLLARASAWADVVGLSDRRPVAIRLDERVEPVVVAVGALIAGRALVPLDPQLSPDRAARIVALADAQLLDIDMMARAPTAAAASRARPEDPATIVFTSGSTGEPKGVVFDHENAVGKALDAVRGQDLGHGDRIADLMPLGFSAGLTTLLTGFAAGATVLLADSRRTGVEPLLGWLESEGATAINSSVSLVRRLATAVRDGGHPPLATVRQITFYGEPSNGDDVILARHLSDPVPRVINWYGATEVGLVGFTVYAGDDDVPPGRVVAGRGLPGPRVVTIVGENGRPLPVGAVGEVIVHGGTIARGYVSGPSERFLPDTGSGRGYGTGDRGLLEADGTLRILGRADDAVKVRGYLVEPAEVEVAILGVPGVAEAFVRGHEADGAVELIAYVGSGSLTAGDAEARVRAHAAATLAPWMVPRFVVAMNALPRTDRGKVDRAALPAPRTHRRGRRRSPDVVESAVRLAMIRALGHDDVDADEDLVAMGVDSLMLARISLTVRQLLNVEVDVAAFTAAPTIDTLTRTVRKANRDGTDRGAGVLVPLRTGGANTPLVLVAGAGAPAAAFGPLVRTLAPGRPVHGFQAQGLERAGRPDTTIVAMARRNIDHLTTVQPHGPYHLAGHSMGGLVAVEMAAQLADRGESVAHVVLIDSALTSSLVADLPVSEPQSDDDEVHFEHDGPVQPEMVMSNRQILGLFIRLPFAGRRVFDPVTQWIVFYHRGVRMGRRHRVRRIAAPVTVMCAQGSSHRRSWWDAVTTGPATLVAVPGGHVDVLHVPHVAALGAAIDSTLRD